MRTIAIIFLTYLLLKYLGRILAPILLKRFANKMQDRFQGQFHQQYENTQNPPEEGKVTIERTNTSSKKKSDDLGDYVDFEELEN